MGRICVCHQQETSAEHTKTGQEEQDPLRRSQRRRLSSSRRLIQAFLWARVFMIMILSSVHKHTSPKCFPSCG